MVGLLIHDVAVITKSDFKTSIRGYKIIQN